MANKAHKKGKVVCAVEYAFMLFLTKLLKLIPIKYFYKFGFCFANIAYYVLPSHIRKGVRTRLNMVFNQSDKVNIPVLTKEVFVNTFYSISEFLILPCMRQEEFDTRYSISFKGLNLLESRMAEGRGLVLVTGHYGNWELMTKAISNLGYSLNGIYRPFDNGYIDKYVYELRTSYPAKLIRREDVYGKGLKALKNNEILIFLMDQNQAVNGIYVSFFEKEASTAKGPALLSYRLEVPILLCLINRVDTNEHVILLKEVSCLYELGLSEFLQKTTQEFTYLLEQAIRECPEQWWWFHDRWKTKRQIK